MMNWLKGLLVKIWSLSIKKKIIGLVVIFIAGWFLFSQINSSSNKPTYQTATAERGTLVTSVTASGTISSVANSTITTQATGVVSNVYVKNGDFVQQGQNIATIALDSTSLQKQAAAYSAYLSAQNTLNTAQAKINSLQSALFKANQNFVNDKGINNPSDQQKADPKYVEENADWLQAEADYKNQQGVIAQAQTALSAAWLTYTQTSANIIAPISGNVENLAITPGFPLVSTVTSSSSNNSQTPQTVGNIQLKDGVVTATVNLSEIDVTKVKIGQKVTMTLDAFSGKTFTGKVGAINTNGVVSSGVTTYPTTIAFDSAPENIYPNMGVTATIITDIKNDVVIVPNSAIQNQNGDLSVRVMKNGQPQSVTVETGEVSDTQTEIVSGVNEGDVVITGTITTRTGTATTSPFSAGFGGRNFGGGNGARIQQR